MNFTRSLIYKISYQQLRSMNYGLISKQKMGDDLLSHPPSFTLPPAQRAPAAPLTPRPTAFHSPASIRRFPPGTRRRYVRVWQPD